MEHKIYRVVSFEHARRFILKVTFEDGATQIIDFLPVLAGGLYGPLQDQELFDQLDIDPEVHKLVWPNGEDFDPATLPDGPNSSVK